jgi:HEAT repeat protein
MINSAVRGFPVELDGAGWDEWRRDLFPDDRSEADFSVVLARARDDLAEVRRRLAAGIAAGDLGAARAVVELVSSGKAMREVVAPLREAVRTARGELLVHLALALHLVTGEESWGEPIASVLTADRDPRHRIAAAAALAEFDPTLALIQALGLAMHDPEYLVRCHAANTLLRFAGRSERVEAVPEVWGRISNHALQERDYEGARDQWFEAAAFLITSVLDRLDS